MSSPFQDDTSTLHPDENEEGDYSSRMEDLLGEEAFDSDAQEEAEDDDDNEEGFVYTGQDASDTSAAYRDLMRDAMGSENDPEEELEVEHSLIVQDDDEPLDGFSDHIPSASVSSAGILTPPRVNSPSLNGSPANKLLARPFLHPNVSRLRSYTPGSRPVSSASIGTVGSHFFDASPAPSHFSAMSRMSSLSNLQTPSDVHTGQAREVFRWTQLRNITHHMYAPTASKASSLLGPPSLGSPTVLAANGLICIGTAAGMICVYDFKQSLKCICGNETTGKTVGPVSALALSHDHTFVASGHTSGHIQLFDLNTPHTPARTVAPTTLATVASGRKEGHLTGSRIVSIGFVAGRHTALVSADEHGLSFYHSLGKVLFVEAADILRILGKYPEEEHVPSPLSPGLPSPRRRRKTRYTILAMMPLPLGVTPHPTDSYNVIALLTPTKLVVVGLKPTPKTWFKCPRVVDGAEEPSLRTRWKGSMAWFPSNPATPVTKEPNAPMLAYSWGNTLHLLRVSESRTRQTVRNSRTGKTSEVEIGRIVHEAAGKWVAEDTILAVQWLNANQVVVLTATTLDVYDSRMSKLVEHVKFDGLSLISPTLGSTVNGAVSYTDSVGDVGHSVRVYKGKIFLLGRESVQAGTLLTWADRILTFVQDGDFLSAIDLARSYYVGDAPGNSNGLPDDPELRREVVGQKMRDLMTASTRYAFSEDRMTDETHLTADGRGVDRTALFEGLVRSCARACISLGDLDFLFEDLFQHYEDAGITRIFLIQLEAFVLSSEIRHVPPRITQRLVALHDEDGRPDLVERVIWHIDPTCLDINQAIHLCETHRLYDALIYVYTRALRDYVAPVVALLGLIRTVQQHRRTSAEPVPEGHSMEAVILDAYKIYPYLANCLSGLSYPSEDPLPEEEAAQAKKDVYTFLFFGRSSMWPMGEGGKLVLTSDEEGAVEPTYPYARLLLQFDSESFLHSLDVAFEDACLNDDEEPRTMNRLIIVRILLEIISSGNLPLSDVTFTNIFIARNVPKYPQFLEALQPSLLHGILVRLAEDPDPNTREDRQLAAEYLLSAYNPHESDRIVHLFESAGFYRILRSWYHQDRKWVPLLSTYFDDPDLRSAEIFSNVDVILESCAQSSKGVLPSDIVVTISSALPQLLDASVTSTATLLDKHAPEIHQAALNSLGDDHDRFIYLQHLLAPLPPSDDEYQPPSGPSLKPPQELRQLFISLQCRYRPSDVVAVLKSLPPDLLDWPDVRHRCEDQEVYDAVVWALNWRGDPRDALTKAGTFEKQLTTRIVEAFSTLDTAIEKDLDGLEAVGRVGIEICLERSQGASATEVPLEDIWFQLLSSQINCVQSIAACASDLAADREEVMATTLSALRSLVQDTFSALVSISSTRAVSFPRLFKRLVTSATEASTGTQYLEFRTILTGMLESYRSDGDMLAISKKLVDRDLFDTIAEATRERGRGWMPHTRTCSFCRKALYAGSEKQIVVSRTGIMYHSLCLPSE